MAKPGLKGRKSIVIVFGEDFNDCKSISEIIINSIKSENLKRKPLRKPICLISKKTAKEKVFDNTKRMKSAVKAIEVKNRVVSVVAHRDVDDYEPKHLELRKEILTELKRAGLPMPIAATPAWEIEAWLFLFPEALERYRPSWARIDVSNKQVGKIKDAKKN